VTVELRTAINDVRFGDSKLTGEWAEFLSNFDFREQRPPWCSYAVYSNDELAGLAGFRGPPDKDGWVEAAYVVFVPLRGQGIATAAAKQLMEIAATEGASGLYGLTLPQKNASTRILEKLGFEFAGETTDEDAGPVWRWTRVL
jgi:RimJ/RimL family protein N-acetyltransferase